MENDLSAIQASLDGIHDKLEDVRTQLGTLTLVLRDISDTMSAAYKGGWG